MPVKERNLTIIAGGTLIYRVRVRKNQRTIPFLKLYGINFMIFRHGQHTPIVSINGVYDHVKRDFVVTIPCEQTRPLTGNYMYQIKVTTMYGQEIIKTFGNLFAHQRIGAF